MCQSKRESLTLAEQLELSRYSESMGEVALAEAADVARLVVERARNGSKLNTKSRMKIRAFLGGGVAC